MDRVQSGTHKGKLHLQCFQRFFCVSSSLHARIGTGFGLSLLQWRTFHGFLHDLLGAFEIPAFDNSVVQVCEQGMFQIHLALFLKLFERFRVVLLPQKLQTQTDGFLFPVLEIKNKFI